MSSAPEPPPDSVSLLRPHTTKQHKSALKEPKCAAGSSGTTTAGPSIRFMDDDMHPPNRLQLNTSPRSPPKLGSPVTSNKPAASVVFVNDTQGGMREGTSTHTADQATISAISASMTPTPPSERSWTPSAVKHKIQNHPGWTNINWFCAAICFLILVHGALCTGYITSVLTTIEKRFELRSKTSGLIISSYEFGSLLSVLFVSYYGSKGHIPRFVGIGALLLATGTLLFSVPHFIASPIKFNLNDTLQTVGEMAIKVGNTPAICELSPHPSTLTPNTSMSVNKERCDVDKESAGKYVFILMIAQVLLGIGGSPIFTLGTTYIDNHVSKESSSVYLACMYVMVAFGPVCGFLLGALMLSRFIAPPEPADLPDSAVIGLWWAGFILLGVLYLFAALPFFGFPKQLPQSSATDPPKTGTEGGIAGLPGGGVSHLSDASDFAYQQHSARPVAKPTGETQAAADDDTNALTAMKRIPLSTVRLLCNSVYMIASLNACMDLAIVSGFTTYLPKYLETQFGFTKSDASILTGGVAVPGAIVGIGLGSFLMKRYNLQLRHISVLVVTFNLLALLLLTLFFVFGCANLDLAGIFTEYNKHPTIFEKLDLQELQSAVNKLDPRIRSEVRLTTTCNQGCGCSEKVYEPLCGIDGKTYFSPCHAGCLTAKRILHQQESIAGPLIRYKMRYSDCRCIVNDTASWSAHPIVVGKYGGAEAMALNSDEAGQLGQCQVAGCQMIVPFMLLLFFLTLVASTNQMPLIMVTLRAVAEEEKAFALGLQVVMLRLLAYIPAPIIFGSVIDTTCLFWGHGDCGEQGTTCLLYDLQAFRLRYGLVVMCYKVAAAALSVGLWYCISRRVKGAEPFSAPITMSEIAHRLGDIENLHINAGCGYPPPGGVRSWVSDDSLYSRSRSPNRQHASAHFKRAHMKTLSC